MRNLKQTILFTVLISLFSVKAFAVDVIIKGIKYRLSQGTAAVTFFSNSDKKKYKGKVVIPETVNYKGTIYPVTGIWWHAFYSSDITDITIPNSVTTIDKEAFSYCMKLTSVTIPSSVTSIGNRAFYCCKNLVSATIPNCVEEPRKYIFPDCNKLQTLQIEQATGGDVQQPVARLNKKNPQFMKVEEEMKSAMSKGRTYGNPYVCPFSLKAGEFEDFKAQCADYHVELSRGYLSYLPVREYDQYVYEVMTSEWLKKTNVPYSALSKQGDGTLYLVSGMNRAHWDLENHHVKWSGEIIDGNIHGRGVGFAVLRTGESKTSQDPLIGESNYWIAFQGEFDHGFLLKDYSAVAYRGLDRLPGEVTIRKYGGEKDRVAIVGNDLEVVSKGDEAFVYKNPKGILYTANRSGVTSTDQKSLDKAVYSEILTNRRWLLYIDKENGVSKFDFNKERDIELFKWILNEKRGVKPIESGFGDLRIGTQPFVKYPYTKESMLFIAEALLYDNTLSDVKDILMLHPDMANAERVLINAQKEKVNIKDLFFDRCLKADKMLDYYDVYHNWGKLPQEVVFKMGRTALLDRGPEWMANNQRKYFPAMGNAAVKWDREWVKLYIDSCKTLLRGLTPERWKKIERWDQLGDGRYSKEYPQLSSRWGIIGRPIYFLGGCRRTRIQENFEPQRS